MRDTLLYFIVAFGFLIIIYVAEGIYSGRISYPFSKRTGRLGRGWEWDWQVHSRKDEPSDFWIAAIGLVFIAIMCIFTGFYGVFK